MIENVRELKTKYGGYEIEFLKPVKKVDIIRFDRKEVDVINLHRAVAELRRRGLLCVVTFEPDLIICTEKFEEL